MTIKDIDKTFYEMTGLRLNNSSQLYLFSIVKDLNDNIEFLNIFKTYNLNENIYTGLMYDLHEITNNDWWENISYKYYGTPFLWWVIALVNKVENPFEYLEEGNNLYILKPTYLYQLMKEIRNIGNDI